MGFFEFCLLRKKYHYAVCQKLTLIASKLPATIIHHFPKFHAYLLFQKLNSVYENLVCFPNYHLYENNKKRANRCFAIGLNVCFKVASSKPNILHIVQADSCSICIKPSRYCCTPGNWELISGSPSSKA